MASTPLIVRENFPDDKNYTYDRLIEQSAMLELRLRDGTWKLIECDGLNVVYNELDTELGLMELHLSDGSWTLCSCNPEKHLPLISGLASEGFGFTDDKDEKTFMREVRDVARIWRSKIKKGLFGADQADELRAWARDVRHRIEAKDWKREKSIEEQMHYEWQPVPDSVKKLVEELKGLNLEIENPMSLSSIEEESAWRMVNYLCGKYNIPPPKEIRFTDSCNPMLPTAMHIQRDEITTSGIEPRPDLDVLVFCRGGVTSYAVAHEFDHYRKHYEGQIVADEAEANKFALLETRNTLYTTPAENKGLIREQQNRLTGKGMAIDREKGLSVLVGLSTAKIVSQYEPQIEAMMPAGMAATGKFILGGGLLYYGLTRKGEGKRGILNDIILFAGAEMLLDQVFRWLPLPGAPAARAVVVAPMGPVALPGAPGRAVITAASPYQRMWQTPTRLTAGYPQIAQVDSKWIQVRV